MTKLAPALWIVPVTPVIGALAARRRARGQAAGRLKARRPWFVLGFLGAAVLVTVFPMFVAPGA
jgi:uncharacterized membrane protein YadS